jgi:uncharacterized protein (DUF1697 family)
MKYIALLRAVNVGGRIVKKEQLIDLFVSSGVQNVSTYIQSGNVLFESDENEEDLVEMLEKKLSEGLQYHVTVFLRTIEEMREVVKRNPFAESDLKLPNMLYVSFLTQKPEVQVIKDVEELSSSTQIFRIIDRELYVLINKEKELKPFTPQTLRKAGLKVESTNRNWNTVCKLSL